MKRHDMIGDTSWSEDRRVMPGRPGRRCFGGSTRGSTRIDPAMEMGTTGEVGIERIQLFLLKRE